MAYKNPVQRHKRIVTLLKLIASKVCELEPPHMKMMLITRHSTDAGRQVWDAFSQNQDAMPRREVVWRGKKAHALNNQDKDFTLFSRRPEEDGAALFIISDTKHGETHELAVIFDENLQVVGVRKGNLLGNDFKARVGREAKELGEVLKFDREITRALNHGN